MVTKIYCDHCGLAASNAKKFVFGSHQHFFGMSDASQGVQQTVSAASNQWPTGGSAGQPLSPYKPTVEKITAGSVDLCDTCQIVWMNRVIALTKASEP